MGKKAPGGHFVILTLYAYDKIVRLCSDMSIKYFSPIFLRCFAICRMAMILFNRVLVDCFLWAYNTHVNAPGAGAVSVFPLKHIITFVETIFFGDP